MHAALLAVTAIAGCTRPLPENAADTIYYGGDLVTINEAQPTAEAQAVEDGKILAVGARAAIENSNKGVQ